jgi:hypothetical protein
MPSKKVEDFGPTVHCLLGSVERPVPIEKAVPCAVITVELIGLALRLERGFVLVHLLRIGRTFAPTREMVNEHYAGEGAGAQRLGDIGGNWSASIAEYGHVLASHASVK